MDRAHIEIYIDKHVLMFLKDSLIYTCEIISVKDTSTLIRDKFDKMVSIDNNFIERIEESVTK